MFHNEIRIQPLSDGRYVVSVDGGSKECATWSEALSIVESEGGVPLAKAHRDMYNRMHEAEKALDSAAMEFENLRNAFEKEKDEKNKYLLEAYDLKNDILKLARLMARKFG